MLPPAHLPMPSNVTDAGPHDVAVKVTGSSTLSPPWTNAPLKCRCRNTTLPCSNEIDVSLTASSPEWIRCGPKAKPISLPEGADAHRSWTFTFASVVQSATIQPRPGSEHVAADPAEESAKASQ